MLSVVHYYYLLALLIIHSLRTLMCLQIFIHAFRHFPWPGPRRRWPWVFRRPHQVHGHFPYTWNYIYILQKLLYLSGWSWFQFSIPDCWKLRRLLEAVTGCWEGPQCDGKCSFYFNCYFFRTTPTNRDIRQKAVYFPARVGCWETNWQSNFSYTDITHTAYDKIRFILFNSTLKASTKNLA